MLPPEATVIRGGNKYNINAENLVPGDIVEVKGGDKNPADLVVLESNGYRVDNSSLTGEPDALLRTNYPTHAKFTETENLAFSSTNVVEGSGRCLVYRIGDGTYIGRIAHSATGDHVKPEPQLTRDTAAFVKMISVLAISIGIIFM